MLYLFVLSVLFIIRREQQCGLDNINSNANNDFFSQDILSIQAQTYGAANTEHIQIWFTL